MNYKKISILLVKFSVFILLLNYFLPVLINPKVIATDVPIKMVTSNEERGVPKYDYIIGKDNLPHFRVFFWVPKNATHFIPYVDKGINSDVSHHGAAEKWSVIVTTKIRDNEKLVFVYVPKTFVFLLGKNFEEVVHLSYY